MYNTYFGFREKPFKLVPNPEYLFLSKSHEEALAHLNYAIAQGDGFVEITGEVGTGKTTLCRSFLENLDAGTVAAYIFNPKMGPKQLIRAINDEFAIQYNADDTKDLIDKLNRFLIQKKAERKRVLVLIDEAQNLTKTVLEQLRLLSNLETNREKLIQIILVGQPELAEMLDSHDLRQIGQRISLRYEITPLSPAETEEYVQYRLNIASQKPHALFDRKAVRQIYAHSRGIPRLINIACDRALLTAFSQNRTRVTGRIARQALAEMTRRGHARRPSLMDGRWALLLFVLLGAVAAGFLYRQPLTRALKALIAAPAPVASVPQAPAPSPAPPAESPPVAAAPAPAAAAEASAPVAAPAASTPAAVPTVTGLTERLKRMEARPSRLDALTAALEPWGSAIEAKSYLEPVEDDPTFFNLSAKIAGFQIQRVETNIEVLRKLNMPAVLELRTGPKAQHAYLALISAEADTLLLKGAAADPAIAADPAELQQAWTGVAYIPWKNFLSLAGTIPGNAPADSVLALKMLLRDLGHTGVPMTKDYDAVTQKTIEQIQSRYGLPIDGVVGNLTKIILYREGKSFNVPPIARPRA
jgi:general secretion pathway protein A